MSEKRGQLDALLDVQLVLPRAGSETVHDSAGSAGARSTAIDLAIGTCLGKYRLDRLLGAGGMGAVWEARDLELDRRVAVKVLRKDVPAHGRLVREARAMARLRHHHVIAVYDAATLDGRDMIAMELVDGETLGYWLERDQRPGDVVGKLVDAGRGLAAAHAAGILHRDFKPHNVLVDRSGRVVVTDFGLARAIASPTDVGRAAPPEAVRSSIADVEEPSDPQPFGALNSPLTATGTVLGTPAYMAPEQLAGRVADERADQFSFCVSLWEALAGNRPFTGDTVPDLIDAVARGELRDRERVPRRLRGLLARGLDPDPDARWPGMTPLLDAIARAWRRPRRLAIAAVALVAIAGGAFAVMRLATTHGAWQPAIVDLPAFEETSDGIAISPDGATLAYASDREEAGTFRVYLVPAAGGEPRAITPRGASYQAPRWTRDGRALLVSVWDTTQHIVRLPIDGGPAVDLGSGIHADACGDDVAIAEDDADEGRLVLRTADGTRQTLVRSSTEYVMLPRCDAAGQRIVYTRGPTASVDRPSDDIHVIDRYGRDAVLVTGHNAAGGTFAADGKTIVFSSIARDGSVALYEVDAAGGAPARRLTFDHGPSVLPDVSADGRLLAFDRDESGRTPVLGGPDGVRKLASRRETLFALVPTPDGASVVCERIGRDGSELVVIATRDGAERVLVGGAHAFLARDGRVLFAPRRGPSRLAAIPLAGGAVETIVAIPGDLIAGVAAADGLHLQLRRDGKLEAWRFVDGRLEPEGLDGALVIPAPSGGWRAIRTFAGTYRYRLVAPDGTTRRELAAENEMPTWLDDHRLAFAKDGAFHILDVATGAELATVPGPKWGEHALLAADGVHWYDLQLVGHVTHHLIVNFHLR